MKLITTLSAGLLAISSIFIINNNVLATDATIITPAVAEVEKPSLSELRAAINRVKTLQNYDEYSTLSDEQLASVPLAKHYVYIFNLVKTAESLYENYDSASTEDIDAIITAANHAYTGYRYIFGTIRQEAEAEAQASNQNNQNSQNSQNHQSNQNSQNNQNNPSNQNSQISQTTQTSVTSPMNTAPASSANTTSASANTSTAAPAPESTSDETHTSPEIASNLNHPTQSNNPDIELPATGATEKSNKPLFITLGAVALACFLIGSMIILNRKKSYRPGRKF